MKLKTLGLILMGIGVIGGAIAVLTLGDCSGKMLVGSYIILIIGLAMQIFG